MSSDVKPTPRQAIADAVESLEQAALLLRQKDRHGDARKVESETEALKYHLWFLGEPDWRKT